MNFTKTKQMVAGIAIGTILTAAIPVFASGAVQAALTAVKFNFNGVEKQLPDGYAVLSYNDRTYVPARFVAENLNTDVAWDGNSNTITFKTKGQTSNNGGLFSDLNGGSSNSGSTNSGSTNSGNSGTSNSGSSNNWGSSNGSNTGSSQSGGSIDLLDSKAKISSQAKTYSVNQTVTRGPITLKISKVAVDPAYDNYGSGYSKLPAVILQVDVKNNANYGVSHSPDIYGFDIQGNAKKYMSYAAYFSGLQYGNMFNGEFDAGQSMHGYIVGPADDNVNVLNLHTFKLYVGDAYQTSAPASDNWWDGDWVTINF